LPNLNSPDSPESNFRPGSRLDSAPDPNGNAGGNAGVSPSRRQDTRGKRGQRLVGIFLLGLVLFNFPLLALFNVGTAVFGIPVLFAYLFLAWAGLILLMYLAIERLP
jgi:hypothetical protein